MIENIHLRVTSSPHLHHSDSTAKIMWHVFFALVPAAAWGVFVFGPGAALILCVSLLSSAGAEFLMNLLTGRRTLMDGSACITGLLIGMNMPPALPLYIPVVASLFAILVVKWTFGGLGRNWMNPALAGRVFVFFSWTGEMSTYKAASTNLMDGLSGATPLGTVKTALLNLSPGIKGPMDLLQSAGYIPGLMDKRLSALFRPFGFESSGYFDLFIGNIGGCIGEVSALLLLIGGLYLVIRRYANWRIVVSYLVSFSLLIIVFGGSPYGAPLFSGDLAFHLFTGGFFLGMFFMATDMVTSPITARGMLIYGTIIGILTFLIRIYGSFPEGVSLAILLANTVTPLLDRLVKPRIFGTGIRTGESA